MAQDNFIIDLLASLKKPESKKQIKSDIKDLGDIKIPLIGALSKTKTRAQLKQDLSSLNGTVKLTGKVDKKGVTTSVQQATQQAQKTVKTQPIQIDVTVKREKLINDIKLLGQQNNRLFKDVNMTAKYNSLLDSAKLATSNTELSNLRTQLGSFRSELKVTGNAGITMTTALKNGLSKVFQFFGGHGIITQFTKQLRNAWTEAKKLDLEMTDLARVNAEISRDKFPDYLDKCISKCKQLSVAVKDYIASVTTFSRAGYNLADSEVLADMAVQLEKVGDMDAESASKALLSGMQAYSEIDGYGMDQLAEKAQALNDKIDLIGNTASLTQKEVAEGIQAVGSVMNDANTSVDEFLALLGAANRTVQDSSKVALAIRTSALRIRSCTAELEEMGETTDDVIESTADLAKQIKALTNINGSGGVDILEADGETFRSIFDIYNDISKVYDKMSDTDASALLDLIAGKNRSNQISAVLNNMAEANDLLNKSLNATGTASAEYQIYLESAEAATERFGVAMTESYNNILNGETVKALADTGTAVLEFANKFGLLESTLKGFLAIGVMKGIGTLTTAIKGSIVQVTNFGTALKTVGKMESLSKGTQKYITALDDLKKSCVGLTDAQLKQVLSNTSLGKSERIKILQYQGLTKAQAKAKLAQMGLTQATNAQSASNTKATISTFSFSAAVKGLGANLKAAFLSNPIGISIMVISTLIGIATSAISKHNQKLEEARQKAAELANAYKEQQKSLDSQIKKYKELKESLDSGNLSTEETRSIKEQLLEIQNSLIVSYGNEASNIDLVNGKYREQLGLLEELSKEKATDYVIQYRDKFDTAKRELEKIRTYDLGSVTSWTNKVPKTGDQQKLIEFIEAYSELFDLQTNTTSYGGQFGGTFTDVKLSVKANAEDAENLIKQFAKDLERYAEENNIDISSLLKGGIPEQARNIWTDELEQYKTIYDEFMKAEIVRNDTLRPLYQQSIQAVEAYNKALSNNEGIEEAKANLDTLRLSVQAATAELEGSQKIFDEIYNGINKNAESAYNQLHNSILNSLRKISEYDSIYTDYEEFSYLEEYTKNFTQAQADLWLQVTQGAENATDAVNRYEEALESVSTEDSSSLFTQLNNSKDSLDKFQSSVKSAYDAYSTLLSGNYSSNELLDSIQAINQAMSDIGSEIQWESMFGGGIGLAQVQENIEREFQKYAESIGIDDSVFSNMLANIINTQKASAQLEELNDQIDSLQSAYSDLTDIVDTYNETGYITFDQLQKLLEMEPQYISCLVDENGQLQLNEQSMIALANQRLNDAEAQAVQQAITELGTLALHDEKVAVEENAEAFGEAVYELAGYNEELADTIAETSVAASLIRDLNAAINGAEADGATDDQINTVLTNLETKLQLIKNVRDQANKGLGGLGSVMKSGSSKSSSAKDFEETFDWIETAIDRIERSISNLNLKASSVYRSWSERNSNLKAELLDVKKEMDIQASGYNRYMQQANSVGLSEEWASKVRNGQIDINSLTDKALAERIKEYENWYKKALECQDAVESLRESVSKLYETAFDNIVSQFDSIVSVIENSKSMLDEQINQAEERGYIANVAYYEALIKVEQKNIEQLTKERTTLQSALADAVSNGAIAEGSQEWADMQSKIDDVTLAIEQANTAMIKYGNSIRDIQWQIFDLIQDRISRISSESDFLINLLSYDKQYDDRGQLTDTGMSTVGLHGMNYNVYMAQADKYAEEMLRIDKELAEDPYNQDLYNRRQELLELQQEMIIAAEDEKQAIVDMVEDGINLELDALKELIDTYTDALDAQKDLYDYQKNIAKQTEEIASLQKQLSAYEGDLSEEARQKVQQIKVSLENAQEQLEETEYERYISDQKKLLDDLYLEYETALNQRLDNIDALIADMIASSNANAGMISDTLSSKADSVGYYLSESMEDIWNTNTGSMLDALAMYDSNIMGGFAEVNTSVGEVIRGVTETVSGIGNVNTTITNAIGSITGNMQAILDKLSAVSTMQSASAASSYYGGNGGTGTSSNGSSGSGSSDSGSSGSGVSGGSGFFIYKKDSYSKGALNIDTSIIDRLKYHDFDSSFSARQMYYSKMGLPGTYTGTAAQNAKMLEWMKLNGYKNGVLNAKQGEWAWTQEGGDPEMIMYPNGVIVYPDGSIRTSDGAMLTPVIPQTSVIPADESKTLWNFAHNPSSFLQDQIRNMLPPASQNISSENITNYNTVNLQLDTSGIHDKEGFIHFITHDKSVKNALVTMTTGEGTGNSTLKKYNA